MEQKLNIAEILKKKAPSTKLWSPLFGNVYFSFADTNLVTVFHHKASSKFYANAKLFDYDEAEPTLFPSEEMRDWHRFAWERGDVLVSSDGGAEVIFDRWYDDTYTSFYCRHYLNSENKNKIVYYEDFLCTTERYSLENKDTAQTYINTIEERLGGKLNMGTLEIEPAQPKFKDGDIVYISGRGYFAYGIVKSIDNLSKKLEYYVLNDISTLKVDDWLSFEDKHIQPITETQKIILFKALANEGKAWDADKKQIVDLKSLWTPKPFDRVLVRDNVDEEWNIDFFERMGTSEIYKYRCMNSIWVYCIPYEGNEHLLDTNKGVEG